MSIQVMTAPGALVALGLGVSDVSTLVALGRRVGNWWTATDGDKEFLSLLEEDASNILQRRGLLDVPSFNKRWSKQIQLLANGCPLRLEDRDIEQVLKDSKALLQDLSLFTSVMTCLVAVLEQFVKQDLVRDIVYNMLKSLLKLHENGEDILRSQYSSRLNAWRSTAVLRGLNLAADKYRRELVRNGHVMSGLLPRTESKYVEEFLTWLLGSHEPFFKTSSSDVAGIAICLSQLGIDIIDVQSVESLEASQRPCTVIHSAQPFIHSITTPEGTRVIVERDASITVPLKHPEEAVSVFPIGHDARSRCRIAWKEGRKAAKAIRISVRGARTNSNMYQEYYQSARRRRPWEVSGSLAARLEGANLVYVLIDSGTPAGRASDELYRLALDFGFHSNQEIVTGLQNCLGNTFTSVLSWLSTTTSSDEFHIGSDISDAEMTDTQKIDAFCIFQSFIMGYYYDIFGRLVDTSSLASQTVEGSWGFRSADFLRYMRSHSLRTMPPDSPRARSFGQARLLPLLSMLFVGGHATGYDPEKAEERFRNVDCLGIIGKRTLITNSLLGKCSSPQQIGCFTLLDVDVGGIPRDFNGLIKPGVLPSEVPLVDCLDDGYEEFDLSESSPSDDVTFHIEADWEANPDTVLLCVRYRGRRLAAISPIPADYLFCNAHVPPEGGPRQSAHRNRLYQGVEADISALLRDPPVLPYSYRPEVPVLFQALNRPGLRYAATALYGRRSDIKVATDCVEGARNAAIEALRPAEVGFIIVGGLTGTAIGDALIQRADVQNLLYEIY
ncbi:uncharacterized protein FMAN_15348 [Fusarium mangiferae]|uniref:Uncharacterized protein n=1 Tax=Fusarium mangiferae TaxID=192010 RepID=A0A1L7UDJ8_FUSMA|nr:uncharacterized protein FMAN_15348 [Fusarium mangiferae]CVL07242.1 uncharacterized protein FMAN_15348 [Fusarium mangiferae]